MTAPLMPGQRRPRPNLRKARIGRGWSQLQAAMKIRDLGRKLGYSADELGVDEHAVSRWERGQKDPSARYIRIMVQLYGLSPDRLDLAPDALESEREDVEAVPALAPHRQAPVLRNPDFSNASLDGPADQGFIELVHQTIRQLVLFDNHYGADDIAPIAVRLFRSVTRRLTTGRYQPAIERDLMAAAGEIGELAGWLLFDADQQEAARQLNHDALYWANLAGDTGMVNFILSNVGLQAIHLNRPLEALHVAQRVRDGESRLSPRVRALVHVREGRALALTGQQHDALRDFARARAFFSDGVRGSDPQWTWWIDDFEITGHEGLCHREGGDARGAVELFNRAIETCPPGRARDRFMYHAHLLSTTVELGDWPEALSAIDRAAPLVGEMASGRVASFLINATASVRQATSAPPSVRDGAKYLDGLLVEAGHRTHGAVDGDKPLENMATRLGRPQSRQGLSFLR
jgi:transcriptional regulator with XRE-family HTH domain